MHRLPNSDITDARRPDRLKNQSWNRPVETWGGQSAHTNPGRFPSTESLQNRLSNRPPKRHL
ncbi:hypothetical protein BD310DRAFT_918133 [Dichomitus squalens]|uniref:Uncharacterized protein n=1 Tax=Dichomitus squalens TaxID=114155 RepID=A0A4Q9Q637_9APHY|nr:hypothetical protein BD310DRAFT_918133 [Dichomitus squalens]